HQMNVKVSNEFGQYFVRLPLKKSAKIVHGNSLKIDWESVVAKKKLNFILGNPPFVGHHYQNAEQKKDMGLIFHAIKGHGVLDYVACWYYKAASFIKDSLIKVGYVSTNSITQGEQVGLLWTELLNNFGIKIHFAHRTFQWNNEAKGNAAVHCVIVGFANFDSSSKILYEYPSVRSEPLKLSAKQINPYLVDGADVVIKNRSTPICNVPKMIWGNKPSDGGNFLFDNEEEKNEFLAKEPKSIKFVRPFLSGGDFINDRKRWCLWLKDITPNELREMKEVVKRVEKVKQMRLASVASVTQKKANTPTLFAQISQPDTNYLAIPEVSSEKRKYIPIGFLESNIIASNKIQLVPSATLYLFGILTSEMHMTWMKYVCGRLESRYSYSSTIVYNNYPFPENVSDKQKQKVETAAQKVLDTRAKYPDSSLADLYDPLTMPPDLVKAHQALDKAVDLCYRPQPFVSELNRIEYLFSLYEALSAPLLKVEKKKRSKKKDS
ncbi:MAG: type IIL restriction-modification enzyme MmeI, partial [Planktothrix agardhii]